ncbi:hypothetical protein MES5069_140032 [Mesorhizobium escarrei]|uniref:Uncharacterized protein n=1 Tax=Mesorhizobium escarrei TaxID=666018 RepID=A0ABN8JL20_9HYPH|nr:hypothetical protein MES5069_140032 [Mesorhizobium escarrei]
MGCAVRRCGARLPVALAIAVALGRAQQVLLAIGGLSVASVACWNCVGQSEANGIFNGTLIYLDARTSSAAKYLRNANAKTRLDRNVYRHRRNCR